MCTLIILGNNKYIWSVFGSFPIVTGLLKRKQLTFLDIKFSF